MIKPATRDNYLVGVLTSAVASSLCVITLQIKAFFSHLACRFLHVQQLTVTRIVMVTDRKDVAMLPLCVARRGLSMMCFVVSSWWSGDMWISK